MRIIIVFVAASLIGLLIQATLVHSSFPSAVAPDFILILTVAIALYYHSAWGTLAAFSLGAFADFASAEYLGPNAAGCVTAFCLVGLIANRVYADKIVAVMIITFVCSVAKSVTILFMLFFYTDDFAFAHGLLKATIGEAFFSALFAPIVLRLVRNRMTPAVSAGKTHGVAVFRWSA